jgi:hypothetical protein
MVMDKLMLAGQYLNQVINLHVCVLVYAMLLHSQCKQPNLKLKALPKELVGFAMLVGHL